MSYLRLLTVIGVILYALTGLTAGPVGAQPIGLPTDFSGDDEPVPPGVIDVLDRLSDPEIRDWLRERAGLPPEDEIVPTADVATVSIPAQLRATIAGIEGHLNAMAIAVRRLPEEAAYAGLIWSFEMDSARTIEALLYAALFLLAGAVIEMAYRRVSGELRARLSADTPRTVAGKVGDLSVRFVIDILSVGAFALGSLGAFLLFDWPPIMRLLVLTVLGALLIWRLTDGISVFVLAPKSPALRLARIDDRRAKLVHAYIRVAAAIGAFGFMICAALQDLGFFTRTHGLLVNLVGLMVGVTAIGLIWHTRRPMIRGLAGPAPSRARAAAAEVWPWLATAYVILLGATWVLMATAACWTLIILAGLPVADAILRLAVRACLTGDVEGDEAERSESPYYSVVLRLGRIVVWIGAALLLVSAWGVDLASLSTGASPAGRAARAVFDIVIALLIADFLWQAIQTAIDRKLRSLEPASDSAEDHDAEGGGVVGPGARLRTLLPLIRNFVLVTLLIMVIMIVLSSLGVDIGPLLAGAGVIGIAIGFGAQTLVRDIVSGIFFLVDDAFRVGEYIEIGELRGTVEAMSVRSIRLRHHLGAIHTIPFGEMPSLTNYSRDWVIMKLEFRVPFDTDLKLVKRLVKQLGKDLMADPVLGSGFIDPLKSQGVRRWEEFNMVIGIKFTAKPGQQWLIRKEAYQRIRDTFEANGIHFAQRDVTVRVSKDADDEEIEQAVSAAAQPAVEAQAAPQRPAEGLQI